MLGPRKIMEWILRFQFQWRGLRIKISFPPMTKISLLIFWFFENVLVILKNINRKKKIKTRIRVLSSHLPHFETINTHRHSLSLSSVTGADRRLQPLVTDQSALDFSGWFLSLLFFSRVTHPSDSFPKNHFV